jgi:hypothetical protein
MDETPPPRPWPGPEAPGPGALPGAEPTATWTPGPQPSVPAGSGTSRRWFLAGGLTLAALVAGAGGGVGIEFLRHRSPEPPPAAPAALVAAAAAERALVADLSATTGGAPDVRLVIEQAQVNHRAHLAAIEDLLTAYGTPSPTPSPPRGIPRTKVQLRAAEMAAATAATQRAEALRGRQATLLASIAACESTHAELLT